MSFRPLIIFSVFISIAFPANAQLCIDENILSADLDGPTAVIMADINGDGIPLDIVVATSSSVLWFQNMGSGIFAEEPTALFMSDNPGLLLLTLNIVHMVSLDIDDDGSSDYIVALHSRNGGTLYDIIWHVNGSGSTGILTGTGVTPDTLIISSINDNAVPDILFNNPDSFNDGNNMSWFDLGGFGQDFSVKTDTFPAGNIIAAADVNGDGLEDIITDNGLWFENDATLFPEITEHSIHPLATGILQPIHLNNDSHIDFLSGTGLWFRSNGQSPPVFDAGFITTIPGVGSLQPADLNDDGAIDLLSNVGIWFENLGGFQANFAVRTLPVTPQGKFDINPPYAIVDIDGSGALDNNGIGALDIVAMDGSGWYRNGFNGNANGIFEFSDITLTNPDSQPNYSTIHLGDLDGDGDLDLVSVDNFKNTISWHLNANGILESNQTIRSGSLEELIGLALVNDSIDADPGVFKCLATDLDFLNKSITISSRGDLQLTAAVIAGDDDTLSAEDGLSPLTLLGPLTVTGGITTLQGSRVSISNSATLNTLSTLKAEVGKDGDLLLHGAPTLSAETTIVPDIIIGLKAADIDNDGFVDIVISGTNNSARPGWIKNNMGSWEGQTLLTLNDNPQISIIDGFDLADVNGDGMVDLIGVSGTNLLLYLNDNNAQGGYLSGPVVIDNAVAHDGPIAIGDIDGDGKPDIVHTGSGQDATVVSLYRNNFPTGFSARSVIGITPGTGANAIDLVDLDLDGDLDVLCGYNESNNFSSMVLWYPNTSTPGMPSFATHIVVPASASSAIEVVGADMDGDGDIDVVVGSALGNRIAWIENTALKLSDTPEFLDESERVIDLVRLGSGSLVVEDLDNDGDMDIFNGSQYLFLNDGNVPPVFRETFGLVVSGNTLFNSLFVGEVVGFDFDNDRVLDLAGAGWWFNGETPVDFYSNSIDVNVDLSEAGTTLNSTGNILAETAQIGLGPTANITAAGEFAIFSKSSITGLGKNEGAGTIGATELRNAGDISMPLGSSLLVNGNYSQFIDNNGILISGTLGIHLVGPNQSPPLLVTGTASLRGGLRIDSFGPQTSLQEDSFNILTASTITIGFTDFDVVSAPIIQVDIGGGALQNGTLVQADTALPLGGAQTIVFHPITLEQLLFSQSKFSGLESPNDAVLANVNDDSVPDLVVAVPSINGDNGAVAILLGQIAVDGTYQFQDPVIVYQGVEVNTPVAVEVGDFDGLGGVEIAFANSGAGDNDIHFIRIVANDQPVPAGLGTIPIPDNGVVTDLAVGNVVPLGAPDSEDLVIGIQGGGGSGSTVRIAHFGTDWGSCEVDVDDIDSIDTFIDTPLASRNGQAPFANIVITSPSTDSATVMINITGANDNEFISANTVIPTGVHPTEVQAEDLNGDGKAEIVVICQGNNSINGVLTVVRNNGNDTFTPPVNLPLTTDASINPSPVSLVLVNVNDDSDTDLDIALISINESGEQVVRIIRNTTADTAGSGLSFTAVADLDPQPSGMPVIVRAADLDNDGSLVADDLVMLVDSSIQNPLNGSGEPPPQSLVLSAPTCPADIAGNPDGSPDGVLNFSDISAFLVLFGAGDLAVDFAGNVDGSPDGVLNFSDVSIYLVMFGAGCP